MSERFRGYEIKLKEGTWRYVDNDDKVSDNWESRPCGHCLLQNTTDGHDGCLGELEGVVNACCGHGNFREAYVEFENGTLIRRMNAVRYFEENAKRV